MAVFKCKMCGANLNIEEGATVAVCEYCDTQQTVPVADDEKKMTLFSRANRLRAACEFDKAAGIYESIVSEFPEEAEAYWGLILCKYGIEYVDDPATGKKIPTCHRSSFDSIMDDPDFEQTMENADAVARKVYREEAKYIDGVQKGILEISGREEPYDIFICYKETDDTGSRTVDSVIAQDIYDMLTSNGYRVFFARVTLEDKLGTAYEPYIFAALNSAKIMLAVGTDYEYYNAVWVKNEWSRFLAMMAKDKTKVLIPCYKDIDAYDIPKEFKHLQAQDMGKVGAMQDLLRGIKKILPKDTAPVVQQVAVPVTQAVQGGANVSSLLQRAFMFLEDGDFNSADQYSEKVLDIEPQNGEAYLVKLMAELNVRKREELKDQEEPFDNSQNYRKIIRFGDDNLKAEVQGYINSINERIAKAEKEREQRELQIQKEREQRELEIKEDTYVKAGELNRNGNYFNAICAYAAIADYKDSFEKIKLCLADAEKQTECIKKLQEENNKMKIEYANISEQIKKQKELIDARNEYNQTSTRLSSLQNELSSLGFFAGAKKKQIKVEIESAEARLRELSKTISSLENGAYCDVNASEQEINRLQSKANELQAQIDQNQNEINKNVDLSPIIDKLMLTTKEDFLKTEVQTNDFGTLIGKILFVTYECFSKTEELNRYIKKNNVEELLLSNAKTEISERAFHECKSLTSVTIPDSVTSIGDKAFEECISLTSVTIGNSVTSIGGGAFSGCWGLTSVTIPDSVTSIGEYAFYKCKSLTSVTIPDSVTSIGEYAFFMCESLTSVTIPDSVTSIGDSAFGGCTSLTSVTIGNSVTSIGEDAFGCCKSLTSVNIPDSVTSIGRWAFCKCESLTSVTIPDSVTSIGDEAFRYCSSLTSVTIPDSVTSIGGWAFCKCESLTSVRLPKNVKIGKSAFEYTKVKL